MRETKCDVVVIGGGVAGLAAAGELARRGFTVALLEARERLGGRILTVRPHGWGRAVELGAEFIHEGNPELWQVVRRHLRTTHLPPRHWLFDGRELKPMDDVADRIQRVTALIDEKRIGARSFAAFIKQQRGKISDDDCKVAAGFIEGFEAAPMEKMSARAVAGSTLNDEKQFVLPGGYDGVVSLLAKALPRDRVTVFTRQAVTAVDWRRGAVVVRTRGKENLAFAGAAALVTLPLGVLQTRTPRRGAVRFEPRLPAKEKLLARMHMGHVVRIVVCFDARKWSRLMPEVLNRTNPGRFGFIHSRVAGVPVWWALRGDPIVTGWAGGPAALAIAGRPKRSILERALASLARILGVPKALLRAAVRGWETHNWSRDPFSRGAYSFTAAGFDDAAKRLRQPVHGTLFFAGEATADGEDIGTVHGALASGLRAAREVSRAI